MPFVTCLLLLTYAGYCTTVASALFESAANQNAPSAPHPAVEAGTIQTAATSSSSGPEPAAILLSTPELTGAGNLAAQAAELAHTNPAAM